jgi:hypothetical protein
MTGVCNGLQQNSFAADAARPRSKLLLDAVLADLLLSVALRGLAVRVATGIAGSVR